MSRSSQGVRTLAEAAQDLRLATRRIRRAPALATAIVLTLGLGVGDEARMLRGAEVTAGFFRLLGVRISAGRDFLRDEDATPGAAVAIVTDHFARSVFGVSALGQTIAVNGTPHTIVGVLPPAFH